MEEERLEIKKIKKEKKKNITLSIIFEIIAKFGFLLSGISFGQAFIVGNDQKHNTIYGILLLIIALFSSSKASDYDIKNLELTFMEKIKTK